MEKIELYRQLMIDKNDKIYHMAKEGLLLVNVAQVLGFELDLFLMLNADFSVYLNFLVFKVAVIGFIIPLFSVIF